MDDVTRRRGIRAVETIEAPDFDLEAENRRLLRQWQENDMSIPRERVVNPVSRQLAKKRLPTLAEIFHRSDPLDDGDIDQVPEAKSGSKADQTPDSPPAKGRPVEHEKPATRKMTFENMVFEAPGSFDLEWMKQQRRAAGL